jgi:hypothetical protein
MILPAKPIALRCVELALLSEKPETICVAKEQASVTVANQKYLCLSFNSMPGRGNGAGVQRNNFQFYV